MTPSLVAHRLLGDEDWQRQRAAIEAHARRCEPAPWTCWEQPRGLHVHFWPGDVVWRVDLLDAGETIAMMFLQERAKAAGLAPRRILRSTDAMVLLAPSIWAVAGREEDAARVLASSLPALAKATGADLLRLHRQEDGVARQLAGALARAGRAHRLAPFTEAHRIRLGEDFAGSLAHVGAKRLRDIRRRRRKLEAEAPAPVVLSRERGDLFARPGFEATWARIEDLRRRSWQLEATQEAGLAEPEAVLAHSQDLARAWSRAGGLDVAMLEVGGQLVAAHVNVVVGGVVWMIVMFHDAEWRSHGVGMTLLLHMLEEGHARGDRLHELGGEANDWKEAWSNERVPVWDMVAPLPTWRGRLWAARERWRGR